MQIKKELNHISKIYWTQNLIKILLPWGYLWITYSSSKGSMSKLCIYSCILKHCHLGTLSDPRLNIFIKYEGMFLFYTGCRAVMKIEGIKFCCQQMATKATSIHALSNPIKCSTNPFAQQVSHILLNTLRLASKWYGKNGKNSNSIL